jgi:DNA invertase Pin-like site-specific DNA recombinase
MKEERPTREIYETRAQGKNKIGRPGLKREDQMRQKAEKGRIQWNEARRLAQDRNSWKRKIREMS